MASENPHSDPDPTAHINHLVSTFQAEATVPRCNQADAKQRLNRVLKEAEEQGQVHIDHWMRSLRQLPEGNLKAGVLLETLELVRTSITEKFHTLLQEELDPRVIPNDLPSDQTYVIAEAEVLNPLLPDLEREFRLVIQLLGGSVLSTEKTLNPFASWPDLESKSN